MVSPALLHANHNQFRNLYDGFVSCNDTDNDVIYKRVMKFLVITLEKQ